MANIEYTIKKLKEQQHKVNQGDIEVWLNTTYSFIEDFFKSYSSRASTFRSLISDYRIKKIGDEYTTIKKIDESYFKNKGLEYISECIQYLNEQLELQIKAEENIKTKTMGKRIKSYDDFENSTNGANVMPVIPAEPKIEKKPLGLKPIEFYTIFSGILVVAFFLGHFEEKWSNADVKETYQNQIKLLNAENDSLKSELKKSLETVSTLKTEIETLKIKK
jgi:hypothetical protein